MHFIGHCMLHLQEIPLRVNEVGNAGTGAEYHDNLPKAAATNKDNSFEYLRFPTSGKNSVAHLYVMLTYMCYVALCLLTLF